MQDILTVFGVNWKLLLIQLLNFGILLYLLNRFLYQPMIRMLEKRQETLAVGLRDAEDAKVLKNSIETSRDALLKEARVDGDKLIMELRERGTAQEKQIITEAEEHAKRITEDAERKAKGREQSIVSEAKQELAKLAVKAAEEILKKRGVN